MKALMTAACLATVCTLAANAQGTGQGQGQGQQQGQTQQTTPPTTPAAQSVTISGCLERDTTAAAQTGQTGQTGQTAAVPAFKLKDATVVSGTIPRSGGQQQQQQQQQQQREEEFRLQASPNVDLTQHVGHQVEVVGKVVTTPSATAPRTGTAGQTGQTGQTATGQESDKAPLVMVSSVKMTASTCR